jgi:uncharacterized protein YlzI (FlbEa/FlbD family)
MDGKDNLTKLSKEELINLINSYKEKISSMEEYVGVMTVDSNMNSF